ncbi:MAG TPA: helix-turn-helix domain-containing protein [Nocardioides sp.]|nr:helix-turn-helix domain-containing protein [Nocardioides sp.]
MQSTTTDLSEPEQLLTPDDLSEHLGVPASTLANWRYLHRGPVYVRVGRHVRYRVEDVLAWTNAQRRP